MKKDNNSFESIKIYHNILTEDERIILLNHIKPLLQRIPDCPGLQTSPTLHLESQNILNIIKKVANKCGINASVDKSWAIYLDKEIAVESWHSHVLNRFSEYSLCYMIDNPEGFGTWFRFEDKVYKPECPTNSAIIFSPTLEHTGPANVKKPRYSLAIDFENNKINIQYQ